MGAYGTKVPRKIAPVREKKLSSHLRSSSEEDASLALPFHLSHLKSKKDGTKGGKGTEGSKEVQGLHFPHLALAFPVAVVGWLPTFKKPTVNRKLMREV